MNVLSHLGAEVCVRIELTRGTRWRRDEAGRTKMLSPFPSPFHYGYVPGTLGGDGEPLDALLLGVADVKPGAEVRAPVVGLVRFVDAGCIDDKLVCGDVLLRDRLRVTRFFWQYTLAKRALYAVTGRSGFTGVRAVIWHNAPR